MCSRAMRVLLHRFSRECVVLFLAKTDSQGSHPRYVVVLMVIAGFVGCVAHRMFGGEFDRSVARVLFHRTRNCDGA